MSNRGLVYGIARFRFPEHDLFRKCTKFIADNIRQIEAKDTAIAIWALYRLQKFT
jgi:hypothetical protein